MTRLPTPGGDDGAWGDILNGFLEVSHEADGTLADNTVGSGQLQSGAVTNAQLDSTTQNAITKAGSSVQKVNSKSPDGSGNVSLSASDVSALDEATADGRYILASQEGAANGVAQLGASSTLKTAQIPGSVVNGTGQVQGAQPIWNGSSFIFAFPTFQVEAFGAKGDGTTDDTAAIQSAINAAAATVASGSKGGRVTFSTAVYKISSALAVPALVSLEGTGGGNQFYGMSTVIKQTSTTANGITIANAWNNQIKDLCVQGPASGSGIGISLAYSPTQPCAFNNVENVYITGFGGDALFCTVGVMSTFTRVQAHQNGGHGFNVSGTSGTFTSCWANFNTGSGWYVGGTGGINANYLSFSGCGADQNVGNGWEFHNAEGVSVAGCGAELNGGPYQVWLTDSCFGVSFNGLWLANTGVGLRIDGTCFRINVAGFVETASGSPTASIDADWGSMAMLILPQYVTALSSTTQQNDYVTLIDQNVMGTGLLNAKNGIGIGNNDVQAVAATLYSGSGVPTSSHPVSSPVAGKAYYFRTDTPSTANQRLYVCTVGGATPTWVGIL